MRSKNLLIIVFCIAIVMSSIMFFGNENVKKITALTAKTIVAKPLEIVELKNGDSYDLVASYVEKKINGKPYKMLAYNGSIPGPLIKVHQGSEVVINFKNSLDMNTLLHSHGVRMDNAFDGSQSTQKEIKPGETFSYKLKFPDAGMYWYHPHVREDYQQELGMYGNFLVIATDEKYWNKVNREVPLILDDILIENGNINLNKEEASHTLMGRYGNVMLINGETDYTFNAQKGEVVRFFITNAANARPFNFSISDVKLKLVGSDAGATEKEEWKDAVILGPSERVVVEAFFAKEGVYTFLHQTPEKVYPLGIATVSDGLANPYYGDIFETLKTNEIAKASIDPYRKFIDTPIEKRLSLTIDMMMGGMGMSRSGSHTMSQGGMMQGDMMNSKSSDGIEWEDTTMSMMNQMATKNMTKWKIIDEDTKRVNENIKWNFKIGDKVKIRITNDKNSVHPMQHPIHFHGQRFLVLNKNGTTSDNLSWKDTVMIPAGEYVDILLDVTNPGDWMAHCHIAEHLEAGMMFEFTVI